ncbi:MAG: MotA/TolQ/ExbB proton channel family protein [Pirellulales bacterium]|nr:MotA/TolQ/ExbB proton channel family protein [Pirellulales bacterium]
MAHKDDEATTSADRARISLDQLALQGAAVSPIRSIRPFAFFLLLLVIGAVIATPAFAADPPTAAPAEQESYLSWVARSSGIIGVVILMLSMYFVATVVSMFMELREQIAAPPTLVEQLKLLIHQRDIRGAYKITAESRSFLGRILTVGISELQNGLPEAREAMERSVDAQTIELEKRISILAVMGTLGPMIGLLGTLKGMIASFSVIAMSGVRLEADKVAGGISEALLLTFEGVALAVPAIYFFSLFRNRVATISANTSLLADQLLRKLHRSVRGKSTPPAPGEAALVVT